MNKWLRKSAAAVVSGAGALVAGCATVAHTAPTQTVRDANSYAAQRIFTAPTAAWPEDNWWHGYNDEQLDALVAEALRNSPSVAAARARIEMAQSLAQQAGASLLPTLDAGGSVQKYKQSYNDGVPAALVPHGYDNAGAVNLNFNYEFDFFGRNRAALAAATSDAEAARADAAFVRLSLSASVASAYADLTHLYADRDAAVDAQRIREATSNLTAQRFAQGLEHKGAVEQAQASTAATREQLAALDEAIGLTRNRLAALLGAGPDRGLQIRRPQIRDVRVFGLPADLQADLVGRRPDLIAARLRAESAAQHIKVAKAAFYPNVNLAAYIGQQSIGLNLLSQRASNIGAVGPAFSLPIFEGGRLRAGYHGAIAEYDAAVAEYNGTLARALQDVADAAVSLRALDGRLALSQTALDASQNAYEIARQRYEGGLATYLEVLDTEDALIANQRTLADLRARALSLDVSLVRALGGGFKVS